MDNKYSPTLLVPPNYKLIGHRGVRGLHPENTIDGFVLSKQIGLSWVEFDTRLTKDDVWVVMHDKTLDRTTNGSGLVIEKNYAEIKDLEAGIKFTPPVVGEKIPTLSQVLQLANDIELILNIEVKTEPHNVKTPKYQAEKFVDFIKPWFNNFNTRHLVSSFDLEFLQHLRLLLSEQPIGYIVERITEPVIKVTLENNFTTINCWKDHVIRESIELARNSYIPVLVFTVNDKAEADKLFDLGVDAIFTDRPDIINLEIQHKLQEIGT